MAKRLIQVGGAELTIWFLAEAAMTSACCSAPPPGKHIYPHSIWHDPGKTPALGISELQIKSVPKQTKRTIDTISTNLRGKSQRRSTGRPPSTTPGEK